VIEYDMMVLYGMSLRGVLITFGQEISCFNDLSHFGDDCPEHHRAQQHGHDGVCSFACVGGVNVA